MNTRRSVRLNPQNAQSQSPNGSLPINPNKNGNGADLSQAQEHEPVETSPLKKRKKPNQELKSPKESSVKSPEKDLEPMEKDSEPMEKDSENLEKNSENLEKGSENVEESPSKHQSEEALDDSDSKGKMETESPNKADPSEEPMIVSEERVSSNSAVTKALNSLEEDANSKKKFKKFSRASQTIKKKRFNRQLSKMLAPKSALMLLHEISPSCNYRIEIIGQNPPIFAAFAEQMGEIIGSGKGVSKSQAKNMAAEDAIKTIISRKMALNYGRKEEESNGEKMDIDKSEGAENLPWAGIASFAIFKLFSDWQSQGTELPNSLSIVQKQPKVKEKISSVEKKLPPNPEEIHPAALMNQMKPGTVAFEVKREGGPNGRVTMGYDIDGILYTGVGNNKKLAKKEAAKAAIKSLYGIVYPDD